MLVNSGAAANAPKELRNVAFLAGNVDEAAACEGRGVESTEAGGTDNEGEDQRANGAKDFGAENDGHGIGRVNSVQGKDEEVSNVGQDVAQNDEGHGCVNDPWKVSTGIAKFTNHIIGLVFG